MLATVKSVKSTKGASFYELIGANAKLKMLIIGDNGALIPNERIRISVKSSDVAVALSPICDISISNCLKCEVVGLNVGEILATVTLRLDDESLIESIITASSARGLNLSIGLRVYALIKATSLFVKERI
ncbi:molybdopterin-binding protein [Campylobacter sp. 19-13652]|uniref:TOBE domain-containing protein n=1 Tax=Campylobacter sp. 19-13652 TaxID=2840180 RepID=UPI001C760871|nr:TOBE domain-containing protein [Campylobacter sp. 19-13652]BCX78913.1 hypothetical protein LBC_03750 [Campylobacter sp. 19-13652]